jgi:mannosylglycoprotein endo-beta-mannosidase
MCWVSWSTVCKEKKDGGLGVKDINVVNASLLAKWWWKLLKDEPALWKDVLIARYGGRVASSVSLNGLVGGRSVSAWWKDICLIEEFIVSKNWFDEVVEHIVVNGASTSFWSQKWVGNFTLESTFPRLFSLSDQKEAMVSELAVCGVDSIVWNFNWRRVLFVWEETLVNRLYDLLNQMRLSAGPDVWWWKGDPEGLFSVKSAYSIMFSLVSGAGELVERVNPVFDRIWKSPAPSKLIAFSWQVLHNRIPTKDNLVRRGIFRGDSPGNCVVCSGSLESVTHLFLHCDFAFSIWLDIFRWLDVSVIMPGSLSIMFEYFIGLAKSKKARKGFMLVWHTTLWQIWRSRDDVIFSNKLMTAAECAEEIKVLSWKWSAHKLKISPCLYYEWVWDPGDCFHR